MPPTLTESSSAPMAKTKVTLARTPRCAHGPRRERQRATRMIRRAGSGGCSARLTTSGDQLVAHSADREDVTGECWVRLDLGAQAPDVDVDQPAVAEVVVAPHPVEQLLAREHLVGVGRQLAEESELGPRAVDVDLAALMSQHALLGDELEVAE